MSRFAARRAMLLKVNGTAHAGRTFAQASLRRLLTNAVYAGLIALYLCQLVDAWRINAPVLRGEPVAAIHRYKFRQVAVLSLAYFVTFGSELAMWRASTFA